MAEMVKQTEGKEELLQSSKVALIAMIQEIDDEYLLKSILTYARYLKRALAKK